LEEFSCIHRCRDTKADLDLIGPPTPQQVIGAAAQNIEKGLQGVNIDVAKYFAPVATRILNNGVKEAETPVQVLAVVMASMSGYKELPKEKSILGQQEGNVTLGINTPAMRGFPSTGTLIGAIRRLCGEDVANRIGKVELFEDAQEAGYEAAFDIPKKMAKEVMEKCAENGVRRAAARIAPDAS
jgi:GUCT (NUC152) domain